MATFIFCIDEDHDNRPLNFDHVVWFEPVKGEFRIRFYLSTGHEFNWSYSDMKARDEDFHHLGELLARLTDGLEQKEA